MCDWLILYLWTVNYHFDHYVSRCVSYCVDQCFTHHRGGFAQALEMHDSNFTDIALAAVAKGCTQLAYLSMQGPRLRPSRPRAAHRQPLIAQGDVTDAGLKAIAAHCTELTTLHITRKLAFLAVVTCCALGSASNDFPCHPSICSLTLVSQSGAHCAHRAQLKRLSGIHLWSYPGVKTCCL